MSAERLRERYKIWVGMLSKWELITNKIVNSNEESSQYQLPALPIFLELVIRRIKDCTLSFNRL
jgi:hypothetical protein